jgi:hypothetical protein
MSNSSIDYFPNNTLASFTTRLPEMLDLDGSWEIGLAVIQYPHSWYNVRINEVWVLAIQDDVLSVSLGATCKTDSSNRDASLL